MSQQQSTKSKATAAFLRDRGVTRTTAACPVCHRLIGVGAVNLFDHFAAGCRPRRPAGQRREATAP